MSYYGFPQQGGYQYQGMQPNALPPQQVIQANGKASIDALRMAPNSSALIMDKTAPIVWLCTSDGLGNVTSLPYDIVPHKEPAPIDVNGLEERIKRLEERLNVKSNDGAARNDGRDWQGKANPQQSQNNGKSSSIAQ